MAKPSQDSRSPLPLAPSSSEGIARPADPWVEDGDRGRDDVGGDDEDTAVRCDVVLGELRPPNDAMDQMIREKLGRRRHD